MRPKGTPPFLPFIMERVFSPQLVPSSPLGTRLLPAARFFSFLSEPPLYSLFPTFFFFFSTWYPPGGVLPQNLPCPLSTYIHRQPFFSKIIGSLAGTPRVSFPFFTLLLRTFPRYISVTFFPLRPSNLSEHLLATHFPDVFFPPRVSSFSVLHWFFRIGGFHLHAFVPDPPGSLFLNCAPLN